MLFSIEMVRQSKYYVIKVILPLCLIVIMSWISFWIDPKEVGVNVSVGVTSMLTMVAYRFAVGETLPKLPYLTRMDAFILGSTFLVFLTVAQVVVNSALVKNDRLPAAQRLDASARILYPLAFLCMTVWALGFM